VVPVVPRYSLDVKWCCLTHHRPLRIVRRMPTSQNKGARKQTGARLNPDIVVEVRVLALREGRGFNELLEEAMQDLLKKYAGAKKKTSG